MFLTFLIVITIVSVIYTLKEEEKEERIKFKHFCYVFVVGFLISLLYSLLEQFNFGTPHKYFRAMCLGIFLAYSLLKLIIQESKIQKIQNVLSSFVTSVDEDIKNKLP